MSEPRLRERSSVRWLLLAVFALAAVDARAEGAPAARPPDRAEPERPFSADPADRWRALAAVDRSIPAPLADHPGNIFLEADPVSVRAEPSVPASAVRWRVLDDRGAEVRSGTLDRREWDGSSALPIGELGVGWYRVEFLDAEGAVVRWTSAAVLARLRAPIPQDSPVCVDSAAAWFAQNDAAGQERLASLAALAGVNWVRDRMRWSDIETKQGELAERTSYDTSAEAHRRHGLKVLQVFHQTPGWAVDRTLGGDRGRGRFPRDLRHIYSFCRAMAVRFRGSVQAWEPWNEANVETFGGHTVDEMCSLQKAAWLGFKAGDPELIVGWNAYAAVPTRLHARGLLVNDALPYFDTYNIHTYDRADSYLELWAPAREAAGGRPLWITESDRGIRYQTEGPWYDLSPSDEILKAEFIAQSYASSLFAGSVRHFHFILGHYVETHNGVQFGLLRRDLTPRPAYAALAAVGRFLAGGRCLGRLPERLHAHLYAFRARPDGSEKDVLVAWAEKPVEWADRGRTSVEWRLPGGLRADAVFDYLGRRVEGDPPEELTSRALFIILPAGSFERMPLEAPPAPKPSPRAPSAASTIVLQAQLPRDRARRIPEQGWSHGHEYVFDAGQEVELEVVAYNFGPKEAAGEIVLEAMPPAAKVRPERWRLSLEPMGRIAQKVRVAIASAPAEIADGWIIWRGEFHGSGRPVLGIRPAVRSRP
ncbi:MAG: hypothetical protein JXA90_05515 [Planctomycetes bacterium]|nr:hypothetical protein [Planctomycetota bacterium]